MSRVVALCVLGLGAALLGCPRDRAHPDGPQPPCPQWRHEQGECTGTFVLADDPDPLLVTAQLDYRWAGDGAAATKPAQWTWTERSIPVGPHDAALCTTLTEQPDAVKDPIIPFEARDRICPQHLPAPLNPDVAALDPNALAAALRTEAGGWQRTSLQPGDGAVEATYARGATHVRAVIRDMIHACTGEDATNTLLDTEWRPGDIGPPQRVMSATSAVVVHAEGRHPPSPWRMLMWISGRCRVELVQLDQAMSDDDFAAAGHSVDLVALAPLCSSRARGGS